MACAPELDTFAPARHLLSLSPHSHRLLNPQHFVLILLILIPPLVCEGSEEASRMRVETSSRDRENKSSWRNSTKSISPHLTASLSGWRHRLKHGQPKTAFACSTASKRKMHTVKRQKLENVIMHKLFPVSSSSLLRWGPPLWSRYSSNLVTVVDEVRTVHFFFPFPQCYLKKHSHMAGAKNRLKRHSSKSGNWDRFMWQPELFFF